jgi:V/A-type H+-transporting ATPase subunit I
MSRIAVVAPETRLRDALAVVADAGNVELSGALPEAKGAELEALRRLERAAGGNRRPEPAISARQPDVPALEREGRRDLLAGEVELVRRARGAIRHGRFAAFVGWTPEQEREHLTARLGEAGAAVVELPRPPWPEPPTLLQPVRGTTAFRPLVETYGAAPYKDIDPTPFAAVSFVLMFGMMFGDVGHGIVLALLGLALRRSRNERLARLRRFWVFLVAAGLAAAAFGTLYGEAFGPTGVVPALWLEPIDDPVALLAAAVGVGAALLAVSYALGIVNRWREQGGLQALVAPSGVAGFLVFLGIGVAAGAWYWGSTALLAAGAAAAVTGVLLLGAGFHAEAGRGAAAVTQATVEIADAVIRVVANVVSFTRLAAFGLMHAALGAVVFDAASALWGGVTGSVLAALVFVLGNALTFSIEVLVAGVQALRLEYYELFSRIFVGEGRRFSPWHIPLQPV